jgi:hypothetical protein
MGATSGKTAFIIALVLGASITPSADRLRSEDEKIWEFLNYHRAEMVRVTATPHFVVSSLSLQCVRPSPVPHNPHGTHWIHVFVSPNATNIMTSGKGIYPLGTMILKQKFTDPAGEKTEFYTGMRKREPGYNPETGDWEFFTLDQSGSKVTARGKIESCMDCHAKYKQTDFVARSYLAGKQQLSE